MKAFLFGCFVTFVVLTLGRVQTISLIDQSTKVVGEGLSQVTAVVKEAAK